MSNTIWNDVYMRKNFQDSGVIPSNGGWTNSPDIIPNGTNLISDPVNTLTNNWNGPDVGKATVLYQPNYFYVRAKNLSAVATMAKMELFYCPSHLFLFPSLWRDNQLLTSDGQTFVQASAANAGDVMVPNQPFTLIPTDTEHHCLISRVITGQHPNPLPQDGDIPNMDALATYIQNNPNMAWRNVELITKDIPTFNRTFHVETGNEDCQIMIFLECKNIKGSSVSFSCGTPIPSGPDVGKTISLSETQVTQDSMSLGTQIFSIPKNFSATINYSYFNKTPVQKGWEVNFHAVLMVSQASDLHATATPISELGNGHPLVANSMEKGVLVGSIFTIGN